MSTPDVIVRLSAPLRAIRCVVPILLAATLFAALSSPSCADVFGRLKISVVDADTGNPLPAAIVALHDPSNVHADIKLDLDSQGSVITAPMEIRAWEVTTTLAGYDTDTRSVTVAADTTTQVEVDLAKTEKVINIRGSVTRLTPNNPTNLTRVTPQGPRALNTIGNPQSLRSLLVTTPGINFDSNGQAHPREDHSNTAIYLYGVKLPQAFQGRAGQVLVPSAIQSIDVQTGGYAPEYGGETAAILNIVPRFGTITPFQSAYADGGSFSTFDQTLSVGGQAGGALGVPTDTGAQPRKFSYLVNLSNRSTTNSIEPPQPDDQTAHNAGRSESAFGNFGYTLGNNDQLDLLLEDAPATTQIANRTGLSGQYESVGEGYGFGGARDANGIVPNADPNLLGGGADVLGSQQAVGQDAFQHDENQFSVLNYRHSFSSTVTSLISVGAIRSRLDVRNNNPNQNPDLGDLPVDNSIEYNPTILKTSGDSQVAMSVTDSASAHTIKTGVLIDGQSGREMYRLEPASQLAVDALYANDPALLPSNGKATGKLDALGDPVYVLPMGTYSSTVNLHRSGYYAALYAQDTWHATSKFTANYGVRYDLYKQQQGFLGTTLSEQKNLLSPRINMAYAFRPDTVGRISYNKLFAQPPLAQGGVVGQTVLPETYDDYNVSIEHQISATQSAKLAYYYKNITNQIDTNILVPATQFGVYTSINFPKDGAHGFEASYDLSPRNGVGMGGFLAYANSISKPEGLIVGTTTPAPPYNDHDIRNTISTGIEYTFKSGALIGSSLYYSSGPESSILSQYYPLNPVSGSPNVLDGGNRQPHTEINLRCATSPHLIGTRSGAGLGLGLEVQNIFDSRQPENFNSGFSGTRFEQGRRILLTATGQF